LDKFKKYFKVIKSLGEIFVMLLLQVSTSQHRAVLFVKNQCLVQFSW